MPNTPSTGTELWARETDCRDRHVETTKSLDEIRKVVSQSRDLLIVVTGIDGKNGKLGELAKRMDKAADEIEKSKSERRLSTEHGHLGVKGGIVITTGGVVAIAEALRYFLGG